MKLAAKIVLAFLTGTTILLVIDGVFLVRREHELAIRDAKMDAMVLGKVMQVVVSDVWQRNGMEEALVVIADAHRQSPLIAMTWVWIDELRSRNDTGLSPGDEMRLIGGEEVVVWRSGAQKFLATYVPVPIPGDRAGALEIVENLEPLEGTARATMIRIAIFTLGLALLAGILAVPMGMRIVGRPLEKLVEKTRRIGRDDFSQPLRLETRDELAELADSLNAMCLQLAESRDQLARETGARMTALEQLRHEDRLRTVGRLASGVAHELGTPLNVVHGRAGLIAKGRLDEKDIVRAAEIIRQQVDTMTSVVRELLSFARRGASSKASARPQEIAEDVMDLLRPLARRKGATLRVTADEDVSEIEVDAIQIRQVLTNLVMNGLQALRNPGTVEIALRRLHATPPEGLDIDPGDFLCVAVSDDGHGISEEDLPHLFEPFFTTKDVGEGTGLGLAIAYGIVREHGGWINVNSQKGQGSRFSVHLPLEAPA